MNLPPIDAVLFDLDNTLVHRDRSIDRYARQFALDQAHRLAATAPEVIAELIIERDGGGYGVAGSPFATVRDDVTHALLTRLRWHAAPTAAELLAHWFEHFPACSVEMPGATPLLQALRDRGIATAIVSNGVEATRQRLARAMGFDRLVRFTLSSESAGVKKPDGRIFALATERLGVAPRACVFVGDHPVNDAAGAQAAGLQALWLRGFHPWPTGTAELPAIDSLHELRALLAC